MRPHVIFAVMLCALGCAGGEASRPQSTRKTLDSSVQIQGYPCDKGYAWFYADGRLERCSVSRETAFGEVQVPARSIINLQQDGKPQFVLLSHDTSLLGYACKGGGPLGPGEGASTAFYPSGKLKVCWLASDQIVQGTPCKAAGGFFTAVFHHGGFDTEFYESGKLKSCTLSKDYAGLRGGQVFQQVP